MLLVPLVPGLVDPGVRHVHAHALPVGGAKRVRGMDPTIRVQHILRDLFRVHTHDRRPDVLSRGHYEGEGEQHHNSHTVVQPKDTSVRVKSTNFD